MKSGLPEHLQKYIVEQDYNKYTPAEHAAWRFCLRQLRKFLSVHGHPCYIEGLEKTGISTEFIPKISDISSCLEKYGWIALPVSGFIPPAAFMELQSLGILPIASDMRSIDHILYTPAPDIVHEAAGHAPIIVDQEYADYLKQYSQVAKMAIISKEDLDLYEAIRNLSDTKENPNSTEKDIQQSEENLQAAIRQISHTSEASQLSRMNWWTAEYGLIGSLENPKIFGAGLLSSIGESRSCLKPHVKKIPLTVDCVKQSYDITEPQPQLFVTPDFKTLVRVLNEFAETMAYKKGGIEGLNKAVQAKSVNTVQLDSGIQLSGVLDHYLTDANHQVIFLKFSSPTQIALNHQEMNGHGKEYHSHGYSSPIGRFSIEQQESIITYNYESGFKVSGKLKNVVKLSNDAQIHSFENATVTYNQKIYFQPDWGTFDLVTGTFVSSVFGGPADRKKYGLFDDFVAAKVPVHNYSKERLAIFKLYQKIRDFRNQPKSELELQELFHDCQRDAKNEWLLFLEILEIACSQSWKNENYKNYIIDLSKKQSSEMKTIIEDGINLAYAQD